MQGAWRRRRAGEPFWRWAFPCPCLSFFGGRYLVQITLRKRVLRFLFPMGEAADSSEGCFKSFPPRFCVPFFFKRFKLEFFASSEKGDYILFFLSLCFWADPTTSAFPRSADFLLIRITVLPRCTASSPTGFFLG